MERFGPVSKVILYHNKAFEDYEFMFLAAKEQAKILNISSKAVIMAKQYFSQCLSRFEKNELSDPRDIIKKDFEHFRNKYNVFNDKTE